MNAPDPLTPEQQAAHSALETHTGPWGGLAAALSDPIPPPSAAAIARLEAARTASLRKRSTFLIRHSFLLRAAAAIAVLLGLAYFFIPRHSPNADIVIQSPVGQTASTRPLISWVAQPGKTYDVWILPPEGDMLTVPAVFKAQKVRPPVDFAVLTASGALQPGADYRVLVCYADTKRIGGIAIPFHVAKPVSPTPPAKP